MAVWPGFPGKMNCDRHAVALVRPQSLTLGSESLVADTSDDQWTSSDFQSSTHCPFPCRPGAGVFAVRDIKNPILMVYFYMNLFIF